MLPVTGGIRDGVVQVVSFLLGRLAVRNTLGIGSRRMHAL
jgi:hypothetical protein